MTALKVLALLPAWLLLTGLTFVQSPSPSPPASPTPSPSVVPTPVAAYINVDVVSGDANTTITVSGASFNPNEQLSLVWDSPNKVIGSATADAAGNFSGVKVKPFAGEQPGLHHICASVNPYPCAQWVLQGPPSPSPQESPSPAASPSPLPSPTPSSTPTPIAIPAANSGPSALDVLVHPPFIFIPFIAALALLIALAYWFIGSGTRAGAPSMRSAAVVHRSRPSYGASEVDIRPMPLGPTPGAPETPPQPPHALEEGPEEAPPISES